jgi:hypothetical protein
MNLTSSSPAVPTRAVQAGALRVYSIGLAVVDLLTPALLAGNFGAVLVVVFNSAGHTLERYGRFPDIMVRRHWHGERHSDPARLPIPRLRRRARRPRHNDLIRVTENKVSKVYE